MCQRNSLPYYEMWLSSFNSQDDSVVRPGQLNEADSHLLLDRYAEWGGNFIDTADVYADGLSEKIVGSWLNK